MKQTDPQFKFRLPPDLKAQLDEAALASNRTLGAEIVARLQGSFTAEDESVDSGFKAESLKRELNTTKEALAISQQAVGRSEALAKILAQMVRQVALARTTKLSGLSPEDRAHLDFVDLLAGAIGSLDMALAAKLLLQTAYKMPPDQKSAVIQQLRKVNIVTPELEATYEADEIAKRVEYPAKDLPAPPVVERTKTRIVGYVRRDDSNYGTGKAVVHRLPTSGESPPSKKKKPT